MSISLPTQLQLSHCYNIPQLQLNLSNAESQTIQSDEFTRSLLHSYIPEMEEELYPEEFVRLCLLLKVNSLAQAEAGVRQSFLQQILELANNKKMSNVAYSKNQREFMSQIMCLIEGKIELTKEDLENVLEGNTIETAMLCWTVKKMKQVLRKQQIAFSLSFLALGGRNKAFTKIVHHDKNHHGQTSFADRIFSLTGTNTTSAKTTQLKVQDPYSMRCCPQVYGVAYDLLQQVQTKLPEIINRPLQKYVIINGQKLPNLCLQSDDVSLKLDYMSCIVQEIGALSFLRSERILNNYLGKNKLQQEEVIYACLSSMMNRAIHYTAENKQLCNSTNFDTMNINNYQNDVFNGSNGGLKLLKILKNQHYIMTLQILAALKGLESIYGKQTEKLFKSEQLKNEYVYLSKQLSVEKKGKNVDFIEREWEHQN